MASIIKSNTYADFNGREILTANNDGALTTQKINYPAFLAYSETTQTISDNTFTKMEFDSEVYDTDNAFDSSTNYRFTVPTGKAGKYYFYSKVLSYSNSSVIRYAQTYFYLNGSQQSRTITQHRWNDDGQLYVTTNLTDGFDLSVGDYVEVYNRTDYSNTGGTEAVTVRTFGGYRIGS